MATNLNGTSTAESNGETVAGFDHARHIRSITTGNVAVWATWGEQPGTISWLASLAANRGFMTFAENSVQRQRAQMETADRGAPELYSHVHVGEGRRHPYRWCNGWATIDHYAARIASP